MRFIPLFVLLSLNVFSQDKKEISVGYGDAFDKLPKIAFVKTTAAEYEKHAGKKQLVQPKLEGTKKQFFIPTTGKVFKLKKYNANDTAEFKGYEYIGYWPGLKMHLVTSYYTSEHIGFGDLILIDSLTSYQYNIVSIGDSAVETPIPSTTGKHLVYYYNQVYEKNSCSIAVLKVNSRNNPKTLLTEKAMFDTMDWAVENIAWIDDQSFIVKAYTMNEERAKQFAYYLAKIGQ